MQPLIINACLTGIIPRKKDNPSVPITPKEIINDAKKVMEAGVTVLHVHARDDDETATYKKEIYSQIFKGIRKINPKVVICATTSGRVFPDVSQRTQVLELAGDAKPDFASLILGSMNFPKQGVLNDPATIVSIALKMKKFGIHPEWEVFEPGMLHYGKYLVRKGILEAPRWINIILGSLGTSPATSEVLSLFCAMLEKNWRWAATGVGRFQLEVNTMAIERGGHVRVGLEDSFYMDKDKKIQATNYDLITRIVSIAKKYGRKIATAQETRAMLL